MTSPFQSRKIGRGRNQAAVPSRPMSFDAVRAQGLLLRGVVVKTYTIDNPDHPYAEQTPTAVYCDVLIYSNVRGMTFRSLTNCIVAQNRGSMHSGRVWKPRASTMDIGGDNFDPEKGTDPSAMDGDHVLVGFLDDSFNLPVILGGLSHPSMDVGNDSNPDPGERLHVLQGDGDPDFWKHHGVYYGVSDDGDFIIDTRRAHPTDELQADGKEPDAPEDGSAGNLIIRVQKGANVTLEMDGGELTLETNNSPVTINTGGATATLETEGGEATIDTGGGDARIETGGAKAVVEGSEVHLGEDSLINPNDGVVHGTGIDSFTGATYFALGSASAVVFAKK